LGAGFSGDSIIISPSWWLPSVGDKGQHVEVEEKVKEREKHMQREEEKRRLKRSSKDGRQRRRR